MGNAANAQTIYKVEEKTFKKHEDLISALGFFVEMNKRNLNAVIRLGSIKALIERIQGIVNMHYICQKIINI